MCSLVVVALLLVPRESGGWKNKGVGVKVDFMEKVKCSPSQLGLSSRFIVCVCVWK